MRNNRNFVIVIALLSFTYGTLVGKYHLFPHNILKYIQDNSEKLLMRFRQDYTQRGKDVFHTIREDYRKTDVKSLITINDKEDVIKIRNKLNDFIFGTEELPLSLMPSHIEKNVKDERFSDLSNLKYIERITVIMDYSINSILYLFHPIKSNDRLIIYHEGHEGDFFFGKNTINFFLNEGYSVLSLAMPLLGMNNNPVVNLERFGRFRLQSHDHLKFLNRPIKFFLEPVIVGLNYAIKEYRFSDISMVGFSSGGWTAELVAAIDPRIKSSFSVAGSYPIFLRSESPRDYGDFEQTYPELYKIANYLELYILSSYGEGRTHIQIFNKYDPCCFAGIKYQTYENTVSTVVDKLGKGKFQVLLDDTHREHKISNFALKMILAELESN